MGEGFDLSALMSMFGGAGGNAGANFGANVGQPQVTGVFGGTPQTPGGNFMSGTLQSTPTMQNFDAGTLPQGSQPLSFGMGGYGQGMQMPNIGALAGIGGMKQQPQGAAPMPQFGGGAGGGGGGSMKGLFSSLMRSPELRHVNPALGLLGNVTGG